MKKENKYCVNCGKELNKEDYRVNPECEIKTRRGLLHKRTV